MIDMTQYVVKNKAPGDNCELLMVSTAKPPLLCAMESSCDDIMP